ncbi:hypothetical protein A2631_02825 [Candidatus Daviesbacteria bacterium RIFCSPHIGHO2_01_FULL_44_29]|uniref:Glycosyltransferase 2-like domain-containing protein n=1 Tax=Candidatus Daviesbacteria bacterium RIFCSPHIGHO2_02_FULL_43_12 TaxID=1797776 RepID=A0A1F5KK62_9BACT|nr:MAG: hypothetical protein A2631_02825 [Candidatus Daviesbacteria bacterium RIFCSPHIGHO2_01_FULL_44_29]OGE40829.1 MAG: hypothetical protein A3E86_02525 [Candidatus Daviesbacteria bacterium RIFCSPHIGHO2_12_FULL_47_45]OGE41318.1 MAG: hypothetical protein A3D25_02220 [Candidatus Daviesbacteria bacterium RIFCSPHIGHO2_02_FULL_43_12]OGE69519.1 MAG: hypothetical protein A3B55_03960 [Candidatus Daviesbacteria bacterium RIFCSPLOWO2_01_FULL_43_15]
MSNSKKNKSKITISLVLIVRNERASSSALFSKLPLKSVDDVYVIDGNSTDGTQNFFKKKRIKVYEQTIKGLGEATFEARKQCKTKAMIFFHPDGNEDPKDIKKVAELLRAGHQFVIPSRMIKGAWNEEDSKFFKPRKWVNQMLASLANFLFNHTKSYVSEIVQGFRGINLESYDRLALDKSDCTIDFQMVIRAMKNKVQITEFPTREGHRLFGETNFKSWETGKLELKMLIREIFDLATYPKL